MTGTWVTRVLLVLVIAVGAYAAGWAHALDRCP